jgi:hypothetical protein
MATVQLRNPTEGRAYFDRRTAAGKTSMEAMRALKRRLSDIVYRRMVDDAITAAATDPGGHRGATTDSSAAGSHPHAGTSDKPLPGPANPQPTTGSLGTAGKHAGAPRAGGQAPGLPTSLPARGRRGSKVKGGPAGRRAATAGP